MGVFFVFHTKNTPIGGSQHNPDLGRLLSAPSLYDRQWNEDNCWSDEQTPNEGIVHCAALQIGQRNAGGMRTSVNSQIIEIPYIAKVPIVMKQNDLLYRSSSIYCAGVN